MTESAVVNEYIRDAVEQAQLKYARKTLIAILRERFGEEAEDQDIIDMINTQETEDILNNWILDAVSCPSWNRFLQRLCGR